MPSMTTCDVCGASCKWTFIAGDAYYWCRNCSKQLELFDGDILPRQREPSPQDELLGSQQLDVFASLGS